MSRPSRCSWPTKMSSCSGRPPRAERWALPRAINELGLTGEVYACGHARPSGSKFAIDNGSVLFTTIHYPGAWGWAAAEVGRKVLSGEVIENGASLGIEGYTDILVIGNHVYGDGWYIQDTDTIDAIVAKYPEF